MGITHKITCDYKCTRTAEVSVTPYGIELPDGWTSFTILSSLSPQTGLTFYRCPQDTRDVLAGEFLHYVMDEAPETEHEQE